MKEIINTARTKYQYTIGNVTVKSSSIASVAVDRLNPLEIAFAPVRACSLSQKNCCVVALSLTNTNDVDFNGVLNLFIPHDCYALPCSLSINGGFLRANLSDGVCVNVKANSAVNIAFCLCRKPCECFCLCGCQSRCCIVEVRYCYTIPKCNNFYDCVCANSVCRF